MAPGGEPFWPGSGGEPLGFAVFRAPIAPLSSSLPCTGRVLWFWAGLCCYPCPPSGFTVAGGKMGCWETEAGGTQPALLVLRVLSRL